MSNPKPRRGSCGSCGQDAELFVVVSHGPAKPRTVKAATKRDEFQHFCECRPCADESR